MGRKNKVLKQQEQIRNLQQQLAQAAVLVQRQPTGTFKPLLTRPSYDEWDWTCSECNYLVHVGRRVCPQPRCQGTRHTGVTCIGSFRGKFQEDARTARHATRQLAAENAPSYLPSQHVRQQESQLPVGRIARAGNAAAASGLQNREREQAQRGREQQTTRVETDGGPRGGAGGDAAPRQQQQPRQYADVARDAVGLDTRPQQPAEEQSGALRSMADDEMAQLEAEGEIEEDNLTLPENLDPKQLQRRMRRLEEKRQRIAGKLDSKQDAVVGQHEEIARQQAILVEMQADADAAAEQVRQCDADLAEVSQRLEQALRVRGGGAVAATEEHTSAAPRSAADCLNHVYNALENYQNLPDPNVQKMLEHFVSLVDDLRTSYSIQSAPAVPGAGQTTLDQAFAAQRAGQAPTAPLVPEQVEFPLLQAALQRKHDRESDPVVQQPRQVAPATPQAAVLETAGNGRQLPTSTLVEHYELSGAATPTTVEQPMAAPTASGYGRAPRMHEPPCQKCWSIVCRCRVQTVAVPAPSHDSDAPMEPETALVVWEPPKNHKQLVRQLEAQVAQPAACARGTGEEAAASRRPGPYH